MVEKSDEKQFENYGNDAYKFSDDDLEDLDNFEEKVDKKVEEYKPDLPVEEEDDFERDDLSDEPMAIAPIKVEPVTIEA